MEHSQETGDLQELEGRHLAVVRLQLLPLSLSILSSSLSFVHFDLSDILCASADNVQMRPSYAWVCVQSQPCACVCVDRISSWSNLKEESQRKINKKRQG